MEHVELLKDQFVDYSGKDHYFIIAAISEDFPCECDVITSDGVNADLVGSVSKGLKLGLSICNPEDTFIEKVGICKALGRAKQSDPVVFVSHKGLINTTMVRALLKQEAEYLKANPEKYITGYADAKARFEKCKEMEGIKNGFTEVEKIIVDNIAKNPKFLDNVNTYLNWINKQKKCIKQLE